MVIIISIVVTTFICYIIELLINVPDKYLSPLNESLVSKDKDAIKKS